jgi:type I restriction enzyme S subunit
MVVSPEFPVFTVNTEAVLPEVLDIYFRTPDIWPALAEISGGTNARRGRRQLSWRPGDNYLGGLGAGGIY